MAQAGFLLREHLQNVLDELLSTGYRCVGPRARDGAIVYDTLCRAEDLPWGWRDDQRPGRYRLERTDDSRAFAWANGPQALKPLLFAPAETLQTARRTEEGALRFACATPHATPTAVLGVRACDLAALRLQDQHFLEGLVADPYYAARRADLFLIAVHCLRSAATCFCVSTGDGPRAEHGFDLALGEIEGGFLVTTGSAAGEGFASRLPLQPAGPRERDALEAGLTAAAAAQERRLPSRDLRAPLFANLHHPRWDEVGARCLSCGNCTAVCPSCFCYAQSEEPALDGLSCAHTRQWDSCFTQGHSAIHGIVIRADTRQRYRQWLTHKLGSWHDQYGRSGCVGCGRCITWCPVGIDITQEAFGICGEGDA